MAEHSERKHAFLSASGAHRWMHCTKSAVLEAQFPDTTSDAAEEGTLAHALAELKLQHYFYPGDCTKQKYNRKLNKLKKERLWNAEMEGYTESYLDYIKSVYLYLPTAPIIAIEKRVDLQSWIPDGFGTADCVLVSNGLLHVIDFKYGKGVPVSATENPQLMLYALGAYDAYKLFYPIKRIKIAIVQPRITEEASEWECSLQELLAFGEHAAKQAQLAFANAGVFTPSGDTCKFCRAKYNCRAWSDYNVKQAFNIGDMPPLISNEEVGERLKKLKDIVKYQKNLQEYALKQCLAGNDIPGWKAVEGRSSREWTDFDKAFDTLADNGISSEMLWEQKPLTLAQVEKVVGKKEFNEIVGDMVVKKPGAPTLVEMEDRRLAITNKVTAEEAFADN